MLSNQNVIRCGQCNKKLAVAVFEMLEIKCPRCRHLNQFHTPERPERPTVNRKDATHECTPKTGLAAQMRRLA